MSIGDYYETKLLGSLKNESAAVAEVWVKLHKAEDPGETGTTEPATETKRKKVTWAAAAEGKIKNSAKLEWTEVSTTETYKGISLWDAEVAGNHLWSGKLTAAKSVEEKDTFIIPVEGLVVELA